jgi:hypothetical protein
LFARPPWALRAATMRRWAGHSLFASGVG